MNSFWVWFADGNSVQGQAMGKWNRHSRMRKLREFCVMKMHGPPQAKPVPRR